MTEKPIVHFYGQAHFDTFEHEGGAVTIANVYAINHPRLGNEYVRTSRVIARHEDGSFETLNTIYVPEAR